MAKIRHISYRAEDIDAMAKFFIDGMGMKMIQKRKDNSIDLSDGAITYRYFHSPQIEAVEQDSTI